MEQHAKKKKTFKILGFIILAIGICFTILSIFLYIAKLLWSLKSWVWKENRSWQRDVEKINVRG